MIAILVPVLGRPHRVAPLAANVAENTTVPHRLLFVVSASDTPTREALLKQPDVEVILATWQPGPGDYAKKIQLGFDLTTEPFVFTGADDLDFRPAWDVAALKAAEATGAGVVGTNDLGNPMVKRGLHSTHSLVRRAYIDEQGGTFDGPPGQVLHEGYDHQCVDTELVEAARDRGLWAFAPLSLVKHEHPFWNGRRGMDATYEKALRHGREDLRLFEQRKRSWRRARLVAV